MTEYAPATVAVVGGGYAGITVAKALDDAADVILIEPKDAFVHNVAALRALVDPSWLPRIFLPYDGLLGRGRVVHDRAVHVDPKRVLLASGDEIAADYIVLATGSNYPFPAKTDGAATNEAHDRFRATHAALAAAERVLLLGAGPVGLELAGEIKSVWPGKQVTIADLADDILAGPFVPALRNELRRQLAERGVELHLGGPLSQDPPSQPGTPQTFTVTTHAGAELTADIWFRCYGVSPVTDYLADELAAARTANGSLDVTEHLQVAGHDTVYAVGDIVHIDAKLARTAQAQAEVVAGNIRAAITGDADPTAYQPPAAGIFVPLGPDGGAGQLPGADDIAGAELVAEIKGRDLFTGHYAELLGITSKISR